MAYQKTVLLSPEDEEIRPVHAKRRNAHNRPDNSPYYEAQKYIGTSRQDKRYIKVHRLVMSRVLNRSLTHTEYVDHINGDPLDNRRENLRLATSHQNMGNIRSHHGTSKFKGVYWLKKQAKWRAQLSLPLGYNKFGRLNLGNYQTEEEAAQVYDEIAREWYGSFARLNFPTEPAPSVAGRY